MRLFSAVRFAASAALVLALSLPIPAADAPSRPVRPPQPPLLSGSFVQEKTVQGLKKPLVSRGDFLVAKDKGVIWRTRKPFEEAVAVTPEGIYSLREEKGAVRRQALHQGNLGAAMDMVQKVLSGDAGQLAKAFKVNEVSAVDTVQGRAVRTWTLELTPLMPAMAQVLTAIRAEGAEGSAYVRRVEYREANGDRTRIRFSDVREEAGALGPWQATAFGD